MSTEYLQQQTRRILLNDDIDEFEFRNAIDHLFLEDIPDRYYRRIYQSSNY